MIEPVNINCYKIMDKDEDGNIYTLFHGWNGSRRIPYNKWLTAEKRWVKDGSSSTSYLSGWHVLKTAEECREYLKIFKHICEKCIAECEVENLRPKHHSRHNVFLADKIKVKEII